MIGIEVIVTAQVRRKKKHFLKYCNARMRMHSVYIYGKVPVQQRKKNEKTNERHCV